MLAECQNEHFFVIESTLPQLLMTYTLITDYWNSLMYGGRNMPPEQQEVGLTDSAYVS